MAKPASNAWQTAQLAQAQLRAASAQIINNSLAANAFATVLKTLLVGALHVHRRSFSAIMFAIRVLETVHRVQLALDLVSLAPPRSR